MTVTTPTPRSNDDDDDQTDRTGTTASRPAPYFALATTVTQHPRDAESPNGGGSHPATDVDRDEPPTGPTDVPTPEIATTAEPEPQTAERTGPTHTPDGREIIARVATEGPHPNSRIDALRNGTPVVYRVINRVLLADGAEVYECAKCYKIAETLTSAIAHHATHRPGPRRPRYDDRTLRALGRAVREARQIDANAWAGTAARLLNERGLTTLAGAPWTGEAISRVFLRHEKFIAGLLGRPVRAERRAINAESVSSPTPPDADRTAPGRRATTGGTPRTVIELTVMSQNLRRALAETRTVLARVRSINAQLGSSHLTAAIQELEAISGTLSTSVTALQATARREQTPRPTTPDPVLLDRARRYDAIVAALAPFLGASSSRSGR